MTKVQLLRRDGSVICLESAVEVSGYAEGQLAIAVRRAMRSGQPVTIGSDDYLVTDLNIEARRGLVLVGVERAPTGAHPSPANPITPTQHASEPGS